jgi:electron transport complex protein RnfC
MTTKIKTFPQGGVHPDDKKFSDSKPIVDLPIPKTVYIPYSQHIGAPAVPVVLPGEKVRVGQLIAARKGFVSANVHSSVSGTVRKMVDLPDPEGRKRQSFEIDVEGDEWLPEIDQSLTVKREIHVTPDEIRAKVTAAGIVGLGGATFPADIKLSIPEGKTADYLIINGVECEPYLTSDHRLMLEKTAEVVIGIRIVLKALGLTKALVGIEENTPDAIERLTQEAAPYPDIKIIPLMVKYPQGGERQLVKALTNREIPPPPKGLPIDVGCVVFNIATCFSIYEAVQKNKPLIDRIVTVTGDHVKNPSNFRVRIGTPIQTLIDAAGGLPDDTAKVIRGSVMMGKAIPDISIPVTKGAGGIVILPAKDAGRKEPSVCIRCAKCVSACPLGMEPYLLMSLVERGYLDQAESERITSCCECGCCSFTCPANRPLLDYIRLGKTAVLAKMKARQKR